MDYDKLIGRLIGVADGVIEETASERRRLARETLVHISTLQAENAEMEEQLNEFSKFLCHMTGNLLSKTNYTARAMIEAAEDYQRRVCDNDCDLRAALGRVTAERDAAVEDLEEIMFKGGHNIDTCHFCTNGQCYGRGGTQVCEPKWRGVKED